MNKFKINLLKEDNKNYYFEVQNPTEELLKFLENKDYVYAQILDDGNGSPS